MVHHDNYYKRQDRPFEERCQQNYDHPDAFDTDLMIADLKALKRGETIHCPVYDYAIHNRTAETVEVSPTKVVIVEGIPFFPQVRIADIKHRAGGRPTIWWRNLVALDMIMQRIANHIAEN